MNVGANRDKQDHPGNTPLFPQQPLQQAAFVLAFHQPVANQLRGNLLFGAGEEGLREGWESLEISWMAMEVAEKQALETQHAERQKK